MFSQTPFEQIPLVLEHSSMSVTRVSISTIRNWTHKLAGLARTFTALLVRGQLVAGGTFAFITTRRVFARTTAAQSGGSLALVDIFF